MFSAFPDGLPGAGLALLRVACGALFTIEGTTIVLDWSSQPLATSILALLAVASGLLLLLGYRTRPAAFVASIASASTMFSRLSSPSVDIFTSRLPSILIVVIAAAVICLGPGAFSLDAHLFGRREIEIPKNPRTSA
jgi:uncharacterized membrane protein YphA (DoxX/SURF4 family)